MPLKKKSIKKDKAKVSIFKNLLKNKYVVNENVWCIDSPGSKDPLESSLEVKLGSGKMQKIKFYGVPMNILYWDQSSYPEYTEKVKVFSQFFQLNNFDLYHIQISIQGFHYLNKQQNARDSIVSISRIPKICKEAETGKT